MINITANTAAMINTVFLLQVTIRGFAPPTRLYEPSELPVTITDARYMIRASRVESVTSS